MQIFLLIFNKKQIIKKFKAYEILDIYFYFSYTRWVNSLGSLSSTYIL